MFHSDCWDYSHSHPMLLYDHGKQALGALAGRRTIAIHPSHRHGIFLLVVLVIHLRAGSTNRARTGSGRAISPLGGQHRCFVAHPYCLAVITTYLVAGVHSITVRENA